MVAAIGSFRADETAQFLLISGLGVFGIIYEFCLSGDGDLTLPMSYFCLCSGENDYYLCWTGYAFCLVFIIYYYNY
jgi:hypothetical protein